MKLLKLDSSMDVLHPMHKKNKNLSKPPYHVFIGKGILLANFILLLINLYKIFHFPTVAQGIWVNNKI